MTKYVTASVKSEGSDRVARIKRELAAPATTLARLGIEARREGRGFKIHCPWHEDRRPSCSVRVGSHGDLAVHCFSCGAGGDVLSLLAQVRGLDPSREFLRILNEAEVLLGLTLVSPDTATLGPPEPVSDEQFSALAETLLRLAPVGSELDAAKYLDGRGVLPLAGTWGALPSERGRRDELRSALIDRFGEDAWLRSGLANRDGSWMRPSHRLLIPYRAAGVQGAVLNIQRRALLDEKPKYVSAAGRPLGLFGIEDAVEELGPGVALAFVEGAIDCLSYRILTERRRTRRGVVGRPELGPTFFDSPSALSDDVELAAAVGLPGVGSWRKEWAELARGRAAIIAFDADGAGEQAAGRIAADLWAAGATDVLRDTPKAHDWNDQLRGEAA